MIEYSYNSNEQILYVKFTGTVTIEELLDHVSPKADRAHYPKHLKALTNARNARIEIKPSELELIKERILQTISRLDKFIDAFVVESPMETALSIMYRELSKNPKYEFKVFSNLESAMHWLNNK
jgi:hypothetical protein